MPCAYVEIENCLSSTMHPPGFFNDIKGEAFHVEWVRLLPLVGAYPAGLGGVAGGLEQTAVDRVAGNAAKVIDEDVVVTDAIAGRGIAVNSFDDLDDPERLDFEAGFFAGFAAYGVGERFTQLDQAAGDGPPAFGWFGSSLDEQKIVVGVEDDGSDADQR